MMVYSFIVPVFNCRPYLSACVESIRAIGVADCEIILVDDGSTDGSGALCDELAAHYSDVRVIHQKNSGASAARNRGIRESSGEKVIFLDADDGVDSGAFREILMDPRCDQADLVIFGLTFDYYRKGKCYRRDPMFYSADAIMEQQEWGDSFAKLFAHNSLSPIWNKVFRREILTEHHLQLNTDMFLYEDLEFVLRYLGCCGQIWNVPKTVYHYRQTEDEGNAKRRLARIDSIPDFLLPIEGALTELLRSNPAISLEQKNQVLQQLHLALAREKISVSTRDGVRRICREFSGWSETRDLPMAASELQKNLQEENVWKLLLQDRKITLRHKIAVWVKSHLYRV